MDPILMVKMLRKGLNVGIPPTALANMFDHDRAAARGEMTARGLIVFKHDSDLGNAPAHKLLERGTGAPVGGDIPPRGFGDYTVTVNEVDLPPGITVEIKI